MLTTEFVLALGWAHSTTRSRCVRVFAIHLSGNEHRTIITSIIWMCGIERRPEKALFLKYCQSIGLVIKHQTWPDVTCPALTWHDLTSLSHPFILMKCVTAIMQQPFLERSNTWRINATICDELYLNHSDIPVMLSNTTITGIIWPMVSRIRAVAEEWKFFQQPPSLDCKFNLLTLSISCGQAKRHEIELRDRLELVNNVWHDDTSTM